jgi:hypothetical protein
MKALLGDFRYSSTHSLTLALDGGEWSASRPPALPPRERTPGTHWIGGWVGPREVQGAVLKRIPTTFRESNPRTPIVKAVTQSYTDRAVTALDYNYVQRLIISYKYLQKPRDHSFANTILYDLYVYITTFNNHTTLFELRRSNSV